MIAQVIKHTLQRLGMAGEVTQPTGERTVAWIPPRTVFDPDFVVRGNPDHPGHDAQGFRNPEVLHEVDVCVLGGAFAYGAGVGPEQCWPRLLSWMSGRTVHNSAMYGWGPLQAAIAVEAALERNPSRVVFMLHTGDARRAFLGAARSSHQLARSVWQDSYDSVQVPTLLIKDMAAKAFRLEEQANPHAQPGELLATISSRNVPDFNRFELGGARFYLADNVCRAVQAHGSPTVEAGFDITIHCLEHIARMVRAAGSELTVVLAPSREYLAYTRMDEAEVRTTRTLRNLGRTEERTLERLKAACNNIQAMYLDLSPVLSARLDRRIFPQDSRDGFPNPKGCRLIAETVHQFLSHS